MTFLAAAEEKGTAPGDPSGDSGGRRLVQGRHFISSGRCRRARPTVWRTSPRPIPPPRRISPPRQRLGGRKELYQAKMLLIPRSARLRDRKRRLTNGGQPPCYRSLCLEVSSRCSRPLQSQSRSGRTRRCAGARIPASPSRSGRMQCQHQSVQGCGFLLQVRPLRWSPLR